MTRLRSLGFSVVTTITCFYFSPLRAAGFIVGSSFAIAFGIDARGASSSA
jgi:hypothetical protein